VYLKGFRNAVFLSLVTWAGRDACHVPREGEVLSARVCGVLASNIWLQRKLFVVSTLKQIMSAEGLHASARADNGVCSF
jgi:hypothetical protein